MNYGRFEINGLIYYGKNMESTLCYELYSSHSGSDELKKYGYNLEKNGYLSYDDGYENKQWAYIQISTSICRKVCFI